MKLYANLHNHSTHSDGVFSPSELVNVAKAEGYGALAVTDHDVITACAETKLECEKAGLEFIFGAEFSSPCKSLNQSFHIVGFDFDPEYPAMSSYLEQRSLCETHQTKVLFDRGISDGLISDISWDEVIEFNNGITWLCNEHVFRAMKAKGLKKDCDYPAFFNSVYGNRRGEVKPLYDFLSAEEIVSLINKAGGIAIVAHPCRQLNCIEELIKMGVCGLEVWHADLCIEERKEALKVAKKHSLFISGGADHSGLCGGQYARYDDPTKSPFYFPELSLGTTKEFFNEIRSRTLLQGRNELIDEYLSTAF